MVKRLLATLIIISVLCPQSGCKTDAFLRQRDYYLSISGGNSNLNHAGAVAQKLLSIQNPANELWQRAGWWNSANILEALIDLNRLTHQNFSLCLSEVYNKNRYRFTGRFITSFAFDDNEWWALTWLKAYDLTGDNRYLNISQGIFEDLVKRSWTNVCGGGMRWANKAGSTEYKNAITNELFMELAARLALEPADSARKNYYLNWALTDWQWLKNSGMINSELMINDGLNNSCVNNNGNTWTYNQGVILGALKNIYLATGDSSYLLQAKKMAYASMKKLRNAEGVLTEPCGTAPNADHNQFKGIYIRYLSMLNMVLKDPTIKKFIQQNADYTWQRARSADNFIDFYWSGPYKDWSGSAQGSALDLMNAALMQE